MNNRQKLIQEQFLNNEQAVIKRLEQVYSKSLTDIEDKIKNLTFSINDLKLEYSWLEDDDPEKARIKSMLQSKIYQREYQEQLKKQVDGILKRMDVAEFTNISDYLDTCYTDGFIGSFFDMHGQGVPIIMPIDQEAMVRAVQLESKISKGLYTRLGEDVDLLKKKITAQVSRSIATGMTYAQTAKALEGYTRIGYNNAIRIARTEGHRVQCTAAMDAMEKAKEKGADVLKQWDATLDDRTRESHSQVDGEIREVNKPFSNGLDFPGDPSGGAAEVINCRCALLQRAKWALDEDDDKSFTKFNGFTDQVQSFDSPDDYGEFKKAFFSKENKSCMEYLEQMQDKYGTKDFAKVLESMSDREYNHYSKLIKNNPIYNKKAVETPDVDIPKGNTLESCKTVSDVENLMREQDWFIHGTGELEGWRSDDGLSFDGCDTDSAKTIYKGYETLFDKYPQMKGKLSAPTTGLLAKDTYAECTMGFGAEAMTVNKLHFRNYEKLSKSLLHDAEIGFHPVGVPHSIVVHELGHALDGYLSTVTHLFGTSGKNKNDFVSNKIRAKVMGASGLKVGDIKDAVSEYATKNPHEWFAECMAEYLCSPSPRKVATEFGKQLDEIMKGVK